MGSVIVRCTPASFIACQCSDRISLRDPRSSAIARQVFPVELDIDHPRWIPGLRRFDTAFNDMAAAKKAGGIGGALRGLAARARMLTAFVGLYTIPVIRSTPPANVRLEPSY